MQNSVLVHRGVSRYNELRLQNAFAVIYDLFSLYLYIILYSSHKVKAWRHKFMTEIFLIRHTQAEGNLYRMMQGHWDGDVTAHGWEQIAALAERLRNVPIDAVYSSDLYRARMTAGAVTKYHPLTLNIDTRLREIDVGPWETGFFGNIFHDFPDEAEKFVRRPSQWHIDGAETFMDVQRRAYPALCEIAERHDGERVAVVSHGVTIRCIMSKITGIPLDEVDELPIFFNTSVTTLEYAYGAFTVKGANDCSHLAALNSPVWRRLSALRDEPLDPRAEREFYAGCYADAWRAAHGGLEGYDEQMYLAAARNHHDDDPGAVLKILDGDEPVGLVDMDTRRGVERGEGWISLIWLREDYRGKGYGIQLLARAIKTYTNMGRRGLRLHAAAENERALHFYESCGFERLAEERRGNGTLLLMGCELGEKAYV